MSAGNWVIFFGGGGGIFFVRGRNVHQELNRFMAWLSCFLFVELRNALPVIDPVSFASVQPTLS